MLSTLSTNIKVLIGISSSIIIGLIYYFIKNIFKSSNVKIYEPNQIKSPSLKENNTQELKDISKNIKDLYKLYKDYVKEMKEHMKNVQEHHKDIREERNNIRKIQRIIVLDNTNTNYDNTTGELTIKNDTVKSDLGFPYSIYSIVFVSSIIPKMTSTNTPYLKLLVKNSNLEQLLGNSNILSIIPMKNITTTLNNEEFSHYTVANINHNSILRPITEQTLTLELLHADGITHHNLSGGDYSITIEMIVSQGRQVPEAIQ